MRGVPQVSGAADWQLVDGGNPVYLADRSLGVLGLEDVHRLVRVTGLTGNRRSCGVDVWCFELGFGAAENQRVLLRTTDATLDEGVCATFVGPLDAPDGVLELAVENPDWLSTLCASRCSGRQCGSNGCGGVCGRCGAFESCDGAGACQACVPRCSGRACGADGCGGTCGVCAATAHCQQDGTCVTAQQGPTTMCPYSGGLAAWAVLEEGVGPDQSELSFFAGDGRHPLLRPAGRPRRAAAVLRLPRCVPQPARLLPGHRLHLRRGVPLNVAATRARPANRRPSPPA